MQTLTVRTLYVRLVITHDRRELVHLAATAHPTAAWIWRQLIAATPWGRQPRYLVRDRDRLHGGAFAARARGLGIETLLTPVRAPRANAIAERVVRALRNEGLDHLIVVNEAHLRAVLGEYAAYYNSSRLPRRPRSRIKITPGIPQKRVYGALFELKCAVNSTRFCSVSRKLKQRMSGRWTMSFRTRQPAALTRSIAASRSSTSIARWWAW